MDQSSSVAGSQSMMARVRSSPLRRQLCSVRAFWTIGRKRPAMWSSTRRVSAALQTATYWHLESTVMRTAMSRSASACDVDVADAVGVAEDGDVGAVP